MKTTCSLEIQDIAFGGKGVARQDGRVVFVPYTLLGEQVRVEIGAERKSFAEGRLLAVEQPSAERVEPPCPYFGACGGCAYQHASAAEQLRLKEHQVRQALGRIGKISALVEPCVSSPANFAYRNRITVHAVDGVIGFFAADGHRLLDIERCWIASDLVNQRLADLRRNRPPDGHYTLREDRSARTFRQTNPAVAELLAEGVGAALPGRGALLIDAYCGSGFFLKRFRARFERAVGIEWSKFAVQEARRDVATGESYLCGDVALHLTEGLRDQPNDTTLLLDPPAEGLTSGIIRTILQQPPRHLLYVSCNPATLARDLGRLKEKYTVQRLTPYDMFPQTAEIEVLAVLERTLAG